MTTSSGIDLRALDSVLGTALSDKTRVGAAPRIVSLAVLCRGLEQNVAPGTIRVWLRSRGSAEVRSLIAESYMWRTLTRDAKHRVAESPSKVRVRVARRAVAALLRGFTAGENALVAALALSIIDDPNGMDTALLSKRFAVRLGCSYFTIRARMNKLADAGVLTLRTVRRGVPTRVAFAELPRAVKDAYREHEIAVELVDALAGESARPEVEDAVRILRAVDAPAIAYGDLTHDAWNMLLLTALDALETSTPARIARGRKVLREAGLDPEDVSGFADSAIDLSEGEPTALRDAAEEKRRVEDDARTVDRERVQGIKDTLRERTLPALYARAGKPPAAPTTDAQKRRAREWITKMTTACASAVADPSKEEIVKVLRAEVRGALGRRGWSGEPLKKAVERILPKGTDTTKEVAA